MARARYYVKMTLLLSCWIFFTLIFMMYNEKEEIVRISSVNPGEIKSKLVVPYSFGRIPSIKHFFSFFLALRCIARM